jgi:hypothetical protein
LRNEDEILFVHIRESNQINEFKTVSECPCVTLLVRRPGIGETGNRSDDGTEDYTYDEVFNNDMPLEDAERAFCELVDDIYRRYA